MTVPGERIGPLSRGDKPVDRVIKINNWPQAIVAAAGLIAISGIIVALVLAGWSAESIIGFAALAAGLVTGQYVQTRKAAVVEAKTDVQTEMLETVVAQTNGLSEAERRAIAEHAAEAMLRRLRPGPDPFARGKVID